MGAERIERHIADVMLDAFGVCVGNRRVDTQHDQEIAHDPVALARHGRKLLALRGEKNRPVRLARYQAVALKPLDGVVHRGIGHAEPACEVHDARLSHLVDQVGDKLDIVLRDLGLVGFADPPEPVGLLPDIRFGVSHCVSLAISQARASA